MTTTWTIERVCEHKRFAMIFSPSEDDEGEEECCFGIVELDENAEVETDDEGEPLSIIDWYEDADSAFVDATEYDETAHASALLERLHEILGSLDPDFPERRAAIAKAAKALGVE